MEVRYNLIIEAIAEWFMQLFFDPMYHFTPQVNDHEQAKCTRLTKLKRNFSCIWYKTKTISHYLFIKEKIHKAILLSLIQDINQILLSMLNKLTLYGSQLHFNLCHIMVLTMQRGIVF